MAPTLSHSHTHPDQNERSVLLIFNVISSNTSLCRSHAILWSFFVKMSLWVYSLWFICLHDHIQHRTSRQRGWCARSPSGSCCSTSRRDLYTLHRRCQCQLHMIPQWFHNITTCSHGRLNGKHHESPLTCYDCRDFACLNMVELPGHHERLSAAHMCALSNQYRTKIGKWWKMTKLAKTSKTSMQRKTSNVFKCCNPSWHVDKFHQISITMWTPIDRFKS